MSKKSRRQRRRERRLASKYGQGVTCKNVTWFTKRSYHQGDRIYFGECDKSTWPEEGDIVTIIDHANGRSIRRVQVVQMGHKAFTFNPIEGSIQE